jgi:hypothetical protein
LPAPTFFIILMLLENFEREVLPNVRTRNRYCRVVNAIVDFIVKHLGGFLRAISSGIEKGFEAM